MSRWNRGDRTRGARSERLSPQLDVRLIRIERVLLDELRALLREAVDPALEGVALLSVELSPDGGYARIAYVVAAEVSSEEGAARRSTSLALERAAGFFRARLASHLDLRRVPTVGFTFVGLEAPAVPNDGGVPCPE
jgi:ribosome-binding factor A